MRSKDDREILDQLIPSSHESDGKMKRKLNARHLEMIAIGGTIGTGLFVATGTALATAGPLGCLISYMTVGIMVYFVVTSLGEMATYMPITGSFNAYASRFIDEALGFSMGWNYFLSWAISLPIEISAISLILQFWFPGVPPWVWCATVLSLIFGMNLLGVEGFGETEYWFSLIKIIAVTAFIIIGIVIVSGGGSVPAYGFKNWNIPPGPIVNGFYGIITVYSTAFFAYGGTELIGITAGEAENPRQSVPKAINGTFWRITIFYVLSIFILGLLIPHNDPQLSLLNQSHDGSLTPFTLAFENAGISYMAHVMNGVILIAALSASNSCLYATSRTMSALASENKAPKIFSYTTSWGVPLNSLILSTSFGLLSLLGASFGSNIVFVWLTNITGISSLITWVFICIIHLRFRKAYEVQGYSIDRLPYRAPFFPYGQYLAIFMGAVVLFGEGYSIVASPDGFDWVSMIGLYSGIPFYLLLYVVYKYTYKSKIIPLMECDLVSGLMPLRDEELMEVKLSLDSRIERFKTRARHFYRSKIVAGSYERLLYGLVSTISDQDEQLSASALEPEFIFPAHISCIKAVACNHRFLASGSTDELVKIYDLKLKKEIGNLMHHTGAVTCLQFFRKSHLITASEDGTISLIRTSDWEVLKTLTGHKYSVNSFDVHPSGKAMLSVGKEGTLKCWDLERGLCAYSMKLPASAELVNWSDDGSLYAILMDRVVQVNQLHEGKTVGEITSSVRINSILFTTLNGEPVIVLGFENSTIGIYSVDGKEIISWDTKDESRVKSMDAYSENGLHILVNISSNGKINLWNLKSIKESQTPIVSYDTKSRLTSVMITTHVKSAKKETVVEPTDEYVSEFEEQPVKRQRIQVTMHGSDQKSLKKSLKKSLRKKLKKK